MKANLLLVAYPAMLLAVSVAILSSLRKARCKLSRPDQRETWNLIL
jgi:hypothetical protein